MDSTDRIEHSDLASVRRIEPTPRRGGSSPSK
jgi:hypothetical protein